MVETVPVKILHSIHNAPDAKPPTANIQRDLNFDPSIKDQDPAFDPIRDYQKNAMKWGKGFGMREKYQQKRRDAWRNHVEQSPNPPALAPASRILLVYQVYDLYKNMQRGIDGYKYFEEEKRQMVVVNKTFQDVQTALDGGLIPHKYQNIYDLSTIANILLQGNTNNASQELHDVALDIAVEVSGTAERAYIVEGTLDGTKPVIRESDKGAYEALDKEYNNGNSSNIKPTKVWK